MEGLWKSIADGNEDHVRVLLNDDTDPNITRTVRGDQQTPLMLAVQQDSSTLVELLLQHGAKTDIPGVESPLVTVATHGAKEAIVYSLVKAGGDVNARDKNGMPVLIIAAGAGLAHIVEALLTSPECDLNVRSPAPKNVRRLDHFHTGQTALLTAIISGPKGGPVVEVLLRKGANPKITAETELDGAITPLMLASMLGQVGMAEMLIQHGADVHARDGSDQTALHWAVKGAQLTKHSQIAILDPLLQANSDLNAISNCGGDHITPALRAADIGDYVPLGHAMTKALIEAGCEIHHRDMYGMTLLHRAARYGWLDIAEILLDLGASVDAQDTVGHTPLYCAVDTYQASLPIVRLLLNHNCSVAGTFTYLAQCNIRIPNVTLLDVALQHGNLSVLPWLISAGCRLQRTNVENYEERVVMNSLTYSWLMKLKRGTMTLRDICRIRIRHAFPVGCRLAQKVENLPLAKDLKEFVLLNNGVDIKGVELQLDIP